MNTPELTQKQLSDATACRLYTHWTSQFNWRMEETDLSPDIFLLIEMWRAKGLLYNYRKHFEEEGEIALPYYEAAHRYCSFVSELFRVETGGRLEQIANGNIPEKGLPVVKPEKNTRQITPETPVEVIEIPAADDALCLTEQLLVIHYMQLHNQFSHFNPQQGQTKKQFEKAVAELLHASPEAVKTGFQRVDKIAQGKNLTKENRTIRVKQLTRVLKHFKNAGNADIAVTVEKLLSKTVSKEFK